MSYNPDSIDQIEKILSTGNYVSSRSLSTSIYLSLKLKKPLFLEGEAGVGKTELAKVLSKTLNKKLIRLQCYEGLDISSSVYEWNYQAQMIEIRLAEVEGINNSEKIKKNIFSEDFLIKRPLLSALDSSPNDSPILLIDELDRTDEPFEAYLLEILSDYQISIPEYKTIKANEPPIIIITSNRTREIHDALKRRCYYHWVDYPSFEDELKIINTKVPQAGDRLSKEIVNFVQALRKQDLYKFPGIAETIDWASALVSLDKKSLDPETISNTLGAILKYQDDITKINSEEPSEMTAKYEIKNYLIKNE
ncbi:MoxR family ATPase [Alphaproteobacteria bacterium]|nr:MoxR family ATPase [Alphaproteobacteria bacterium]